MIKYSIIIPVYNTEKYLDKCLKSVANQSYKNYEVIIINDGSTDDSQKIIDKYQKKYNNIKSFKKQNSGVSSTRNFGVTKAKGEYLLFLDSDDYIETKLLETLNTFINDIEVLRFQSYRVTDGNIEDYLISNNFDLKTGPEAFLSLYSSESIELAPLYLYKREYWLKNKFNFLENTYHEDFGLIPIVILTAKRVRSIDYKGYYYVDRKGSITTTKDYTKIKKRAFDVLIHFDYLLKEERKLKIDKKTKSIFESFISNTVISKIKDLNTEDQKDYIEQIRKRNIIDLLLKDSLKRKLKIILLKLKYKI